MCQSLCKIQTCQQFLTSVCCLTLFQTVKGCQQNCSFKMSFPVSCPGTRGAMTAGHTVCRYVGKEGLPEGLPHRLLAIVTTRRKPPSDGSAEQLSRARSPFQNMAKRAKVSFQHMSTYHAPQLCTQFTSQHFIFPSGQFSNYNAMGVFKDNSLINDKTCPNLNSSVKCPGFT